MLGTLRASGHEARSCVGILLRRRTCAAPRRQGPRPGRRHRPGSPHQRAPRRPRLTRKTHRPPRTRGLRDQIGAVTGQQPYRVPAVGEPGSLAMMTSPDALPMAERLAGDRYDELLPENGVAARNRAPRPVLLPRGHGTYCTIRASGRGARTFHLRTHPPPAFSGQSCSQAHAICGGCRGSGRPPGAACRPPRSASAQRQCGRPTSK